jgi:hypothetical protein
MPPGSHGQWFCFPVIKEGCFARVKPGYGWPGFFVYIWDHFQIVIGVNKFVTDPRRFHDRGSTFFGQFKKDCTLGATIY